MFTLAVHAVRAAQRRDEHNSWEGCALTQGHGETGFPHVPTRWEGWGGAAPTLMRAGGPRTQAPAPPACERDWEGYTFQEPPFCYSII